MASVGLLDFKLLRSSREEAAAHLLDLLKTHSEDDISSQLHEAVATELVSPAVLSPWVLMVKDPRNTKKVLQQTFSRYGQRCAAQALGKFLGRSTWKRTLEALGGLSGLVEICAQTSVDNVKLLTKAVGQAYAYNRRDPSRIEVVTELFQSLCSNTTLSAHLPRTQIQNPDQRPLLAHYLLLLPSCSDACVRTVVENRNSVASGALLRVLTMSHTQLLQQMTLEGFLKSVPNLRCLYENMPPRQGDEPRFTASMSFAVHLLQRSVEDSQTDLDSLSFQMSGVIDHLLAKAYDKSVSLDRMAQLLQMGVRYYERYPSRLKKWNDNLHSGLLKISAKCWGAQRVSHSGEDPSPRGDVFEPILKRVLELSRPYQRIRGLWNWRFFENVSKENQYTLLRMLIQAYANVDLEEVDQLAGWEFDNMPWPMWTSMGAAEAHGLFNRMLSVDPKGDFAPSRPPAIDIMRQYQHDPDFKYANVVLMQAKLEPKRADAIKIVSEEVKRQKEKSLSHRGQDDRIRHARFAVYLSSGSGSISLLKATITWLKRFLRDPAMVQQVYHHEMVANKEVADLLAALPFDMKTTLSVSRIKADIDAANDVLRMILEAAITSTREPWFISAHWRRILELFGKVLLARILRASELEDSGKLTVQELEDCAFDTTAPLMLDFERSRLDPGNKILQGEYIVNPSVDSPQKRRLSRGSLSFLDNLARSRDQIWREYRKLQDPATTLIEEPFTQGLSLRDLMYGLEDCWGWSPKQSPLISSRAHKLTFMNTNYATKSIPSDPKLRNAISRHVDSFETALPTYVLGGDHSLDTVKDRFQLVWTHWMSVLQSDSMTQRTASKFLYDKFQKLESTSLGIRFREVFDTLKEWHDEKVASFARMPEAVDPDEQNEWDPTADVPGPETSICPPKTLDCFFTPPSFLSSFSTPPPFKSGDSIPFRVPPERSVVVEAVGLPGSGLQRIGTHLRKRGALESMVIAPLLYIDTQKGAGPRLLASPFPEGISPRFPALFLEESFLEQWEMDMALDHLKSVLDDVPPTLLARLTSSYMVALSQMEKSASEYAQTETTALKLLKLLSASDKPMLAFGSVQDIIFDRPESSSWNRALLRDGVMRNLQAEELYAFLSDFADTMVSRLRDQSTWPPSSTKDFTPNHAIVKVTTIKQLAQMLRHAQYISPTYRIKILAELLRNSTHVDARTAIIDSLLEAFPASDEPNADVLAGEIISALISLVPVIAAINERKPMSEQDWLKAEETLTLTETELEKAQKTGTLLQRMIGVISGGIPEKYRLGYVTSVIHPAMELSRQNRKRLYAIILKKHGGDLALAELSVPFGLKFFGQLLSNRQEYLTNSHVQQYHRHIIAYIKFPEALQKMEDILTADKALKASPMGQFWIQEFHSGGAASSADIFWYRKALGRVWRPSKLREADAITVDLVKANFLEQADIVVRSTRQSYLWDQLISFNPNHSQHAREVDEDGTQRASNAINWLGNVRPVIVQLVDMIDSMRTTRWQQDPNRDPATLPSTFQLRTFLLPFPFLLHANLTDYRLHRRFAKSVIRLLREMVEAAAFETPFAKRDLIVTAIKFNAPVDAVKIACYLGDIQYFWPSAPEHDATPTTPLDMYRVFTADKIFRLMSSDSQFKQPPDGSVTNSAGLAHRKKHDVFTRATKILLQWMRSPVEELRTRCSDSVARLCISTEDWEEIKNKNASVEAAGEEMLVDDDGDDDQDDGDDDGNDIHDEDMTRDSMDTS